MEEISLREIVEIVIRGKWIIAIFTAVCMIVSGITSFFFMAPVYEAHTTLMISPIKVTESQDKDNNRFFNLVGSLSQYPQMTIETYKEQVKTPAILSEIIAELGINYLDWNGLAGKITVNNIKNTNLITISVKDSNSQLAAQIANSLSKKFQIFISLTNQKQAESSADFIKIQQGKEKINLERELSALKAFVALPRGPEELKMELDSKLKQLTEFKTEVIQVKIDEQSNRSTLENGRRILAVTSPTLTTNKKLLSDDLLSDVIKEKTGLGTNDIAGFSLSDEQVNEIYIETAKEVNKIEMRLAELAAKRKSMEDEITVRQSEIDKLQAELAEKQQQYDLLKHNVVLSQQTYDAFEQKYKEALIKQSAEVGTASIVELSPAAPSTKPVAPKKSTNIAVSMVLGLAASVFFVFLKEYWQNSGTGKKEQAAIGD